MRAGCGHPPGGEQAFLAFNSMAHGDRCFAPGHPYRLSLRNEIDGTEVDGLHMADLNR
jgi:hypothetical protein